MEQAIFDKSQFLCAEIGKKSYESFVKNDILSKIVVKIGDELGSGDGDGLQKGVNYLMYNTHNCDITSIKKMLTPEKNKTGRKDTDLEYVYYFSQEHYARIFETIIMTIEGKRRLFIDLLNTQYNKLDLLENVEASYSQLLLYWPMRRLNHIRDNGNSETIRERANDLLNSIKAVDKKCRFLPISKNTSNPNI